MPVGVEPLIDPTRSQPRTDRIATDAQFAGESRRAIFVGAQSLVAVMTGSPYQSQVRRESKDHPAGELTSALRRTEPFGVQLLGNACRTESGGGERSQAGYELRIVGLSGVAIDGPLQRLTLGRATDPVQCHVDAFALFVDTHDHSFQQQSDESLPVGRCGGRGRPHGGQVVREGANRREIDRTQACRGGALPTVVLVVELLLLSQGFLPATFEFAGHQAIFWFTRLMLSRRSFDFIRRPFPTELPLSNEFATFLFNAGYRRKTRF